MSTRRHDIDALRAIAFALVILYHVGMYYVAGWHWHLKSPLAADWLQWPMRALNLWRMDLVFLVSGIAFGFIGRGLGRGALLRERSVRLLVPLAFGMAVIVPYQAYAQAVANGSIAPGFAAFLARYVTGGPWPAGAFDGAEFGVTWNHLWFLPYLWLYTALATALLPWLQRGVARRAREAFLGWRGARLLLGPAVPLMAASLLLWPHFPPTHDLVGDAWLHAVYLTLFLYGFWIGTDAEWWNEARRLRWHALALAAAAWVLYVLLRGMFPPTAGGAARVLPRLAADVYAWTMLLAILGAAYRHLNRPWPWLAWAGEQVYPWYVLHQTLIVAGIVLLAPQALGPVMEPLALIAFTVAGCWGLTALIRRVAWLRPLFGLKSTRTPSGGLPQAGRAAIRP